MGSFDYNDDYSSFDNLLDRTTLLTEGGKGLGRFHPGFGKTLTGRLREAGSTAIPYRARTFVVHILYSILKPNIITDEELSQLELDPKGPAGKSYNLNLQQILDNHKDEITQRADEIGDAIEERLPAWGNKILSTAPERIQGNIDARKAQKAGKEVADDIKQGEDIDDSVIDALDSVIVQAAITKVLNNIQASLGEPGLDIEEEALQEVVNYAERIQTVDQLADFVRQIAGEPGYQKIALYLSAVVKPLRGNKEGEDEEGEAPYAGVNDPGDPEGEEYSKNEEGGGTTSIVDSLNNDMRKRKLLFEKKKNWMKGAVKKPGALNAAAKAAGESKSEYCASPPSGKADKRCNLWKTFNKYRPEDAEEHDPDVAHHYPGYDPSRPLSPEQEARRQEVNAEFAAMFPREINALFNEFQNYLDNLQDASLMDLEMVVDDIVDLAKSLDDSTKSLAISHLKQMADNSELEDFELYGEEGIFANVPSEDSEGCGRIEKGALLGSLLGKGAITGGLAGAAYHALKGETPKKEEKKEEKKKRGSWSGANYEDEEQAHKESYTNNYLSEQKSSDKRNIKPKTKNQSFKERFKPKTHWQLEELRRMGL